MVLMLVRRRARAALDAFAYFATVPVSRPSERACAVTVLATEFRDVENSRLARARAAFCCIFLALAIIRILERAFAAASLSLAKRVVSLVVARVSAMRCSSEYAAMRRFRRFTARRELRA